MSNLNIFEYEEMLHVAGMPKGEAAHWANKLVKIENAKREKKINSILEISGGDIELINEAVKKANGYKPKPTQTINEQAALDRDLEVFVNEYLTHSIGLNKLTFSTLELLKIGREKGLVGPITNKQSSEPIHSIIKSMINKGRVEATSKEGRCYTYKIITNQDKPGGTIAQQRLEPHSG